MTIYNTRNPLGSTDPRDLFDNAQNYDIAINSITQAIWLDRFGVTRRSWYGLETMVTTAAAKFGYINLNGQNFTTGATVNLNELLLNPADNNYYHWTGTFPAGGKIVPPNSTPQSTGGTGPGKWLNVGDTALRGDLARPDGVKLVGGAAKNVSITKRPVTEMASYDASDVTPAILESKTLYGYAYLPGHSATTHKMVVGTQKSALMNTKIYVDDGVTLETEYWDYDLLSTLKIIGRCKVYFSALKYTFYVSDIPYHEKQPAIDYDPQTIEAVPWSTCKVYSITLDTFTVGATPTTNAHSAYFTIPANSLTGLFTQIEPGESISAAISADLGKVERLGIIVRCSNGYLSINSVPGTTGPWQYTYKVIGGGYSNPFTITTPDGNLLSYSAGKASVGISLQSKTRLNLLLNGVSTGLPLDVSTLGLGEIMEIGWAASNGAVTDYLTLTGLCCYKSAHGVMGKAPLNIAVYGDSTAAPFLMSFDQYLPALLDGKMGTRTVNIYNYAVAGQSMGEQVEILKANPPAAQIIIMVGGTNEAQSGISADFFSQTMNDFISFCTGKGMTPVWVEPWMWYPKEFINGSGQTTIRNYDGAARLREAGKRIMASLGDQGICVSTTHQLPAPLPEYFNKDIDPLLRDGLHQSELSFKMYAELVAAAILKWLVRVDKTPASLAAWWLGDKVSCPTSSIKKNFIDATLTKSPQFNDGDILLTLPRWANPGRVMRIPLTWTSASSAGAGFATIEANGVITARIVTGATTVYLHGFLA
ncbi:MAG: phage tail protein [Pseudescherichia vulneris]|nr:phage tail protein [Pseudescherichia vulneris]